MQEAKSTFIFFSSWERYLKTLELDKDITYVNAVCRAIVQYGLYGQCENTDPTIMQRIDAVCSDLMNNSKARYSTAKQNGQTGGRPTRYDPDIIRRMAKDGMTPQEIANALGCAKRTVQRALDEATDSDDDI